MIKSLIRMAKPAVERVPAAANLYRSLRDTAYARMEPRPTPFGFKFSGPPDMLSGSFEKQETALLRQLLQECDVFVNVGANVGYYVCHALAAGKKVVAIEPMKNNLACLLRNVRANQWQNGVEVFPLALTDRPTLLPMFGSGTCASLIPGYAGATGSSNTLVPTSTLDILVGRRFLGVRLLMLVDIEGAEYEMLQGAGLLFERDPAPVWVVEINVTEHQPSGVSVNPKLLQTFQLFWKKGYCSWTVSPESRAIEEAEVSKIMQSGIDTLGVHNFVFKKPA